MTSLVFDGPVQNNNNGVFSLQGPDDVGLYTNSKGGTELMYQRLKNSVDPSLLDKFQIICSRVRNIEPNKIPILWLHDTYDDPESQHLKQENSRKRFAKMIFVSHYQFLTYHIGLKVPYENTVVIQNAIEPIEDHEKPDPNEQLNLIYHTTPHRGLNLLIPAFVELVKIHPNLHLDVFSSFEIYGWKDRDKPYQELFDFCRSHENITYHGTVSNEEIRKALQKAHIFAYPSIWPETSCLAAIESMSAKCAVVCPDFGALTETLNTYGYLYRWSENPNTNVNRFATVLHNVIQAYKSDNIQNNLLLQKRFADNFYNWEFRAKMWNNMLTEIVNGK